MSQDKLEMFRNRLIKVHRHLSRQARNAGISCYRVYDHDLPEFPFCIEIYDGRISLSEYKRRFSLGEFEHENWLDACTQLISEVLRIAPEKIFLRQRQRKESRKRQYERLSSFEEFFVVEEDGLKFRINLRDYLDTGLFLDHRLTRKMIRGEAASKRVLNLFCYTGSFSVFAAAGGAKKVDSVDLSKTYLNWAELNFSLNSLLDHHHHFIHADVKQWLSSGIRDRYDLVVMDPPTFSNSKRMEDFLDIQRDHALLINQVLGIMAKDGVLYFSTNSRKFILESDKIESATVKDITRATTPFDFQGKLHRYCFRIVKDQF
jgi:23S rRNA (cytosine1962-C5)-methyltransferase